MKTENEINLMACKYASSFPSQYEERKNAFIAGCKAMQQTESTEDLRRKYKRHETNKR